MINGELIVDNFAGGGGASTGIELATGKSVDIAINHDPEAIRMHKANHPHTKHYCEDVWQVDPVKGKTFSGEEREETVAWNKETYNLLKQAEKGVQYENSKKNTNTY